MDSWNDFAQKGAEGVLPFGDFDDEKPVKEDEDDRAIEEHQQRTFCKGSYSFKQLAHLSLESVSFGKTKDGTEVAN